MPMENDIRRSEILAYKIRRHAVDMVRTAHASHIASIFSCADIMAALYSNIMRYDPANPHDENRDRLVLSKGHSGVALYAALAESGFFPVSELAKYGSNGSDFSCHVSHKIQGVEVSTGSLGHGVAMACGMALGAKLRKKNYRIFSIIGDGECNEGIVWETAMLAAQQKLDNFTVIVDRNRMQALGFTENIINMENMKERWEAFGWNAVEINGHSHMEIINTLNKRKNDGKPNVVIANTTKGKGVSFMENELLWHYRDPQGAAYEEAVEELERMKPCEIM